MSGAARWGSAAGAVLVLTVAAGDNTLRVLPPLVAGEAEFDECLDKLSAGAASDQVPEAA